MYIQRGLCTPKGTEMHQKRPTYAKRDQQTRVAVVSIVESVANSSQETYIHQKRPMYVKRDLHTPKETHINLKRPIYTKRDL